MFIQWLSDRRYREAITSFFRHAKTLRVGNILFVIFEKVAMSSFFVAFLSSDRMEGDVHVRMFVRRTMSSSW